MSRIYSELTSRCVQEVNTFKNAAREFRLVLEEFPRGASDPKILQAFDEVISDAIAHRVGVIHKN